jgi:phosphoesterase RecJ-like protein
MESELAKTIEAIHQHQRFVITTHINPDGDGIGSELGLARFLRDLGKSVAIINSSGTPRNYQFLDRAGEIFVHDSNMTYQLFRDAEVIFIVDISKWERLGPMKQPVKDHTGLKICIDHHPLCGDFADINLVCTEACASGELVLKVVIAMNGQLTQQIAEPLYASILTDTGAFRFPNTTANTHASAALLLSAGIDSGLIYEQIYERCSPQRVKLLSRALGNLEYLHSGRLAWTMITQTMLRQTGVEIEEVEGFVDIARGIKNVEVSAIFLELADGRVKVSLRSKGDIDVNQYAIRFGGGGHRHASGILMAGPIGTAVNAVLDDSRSLFPAVAQKLVS